MNVITETVVQAPAWSGVLLGTLTAAFLAFFVGWTAWAWWPANRSMLDAAARLPLQED